ncbi:type II toxin-antitoxin system PemK/MazF family toxin [Companilactobacillus ginsenosidimutans]|uniref:Uncharacterized protein n=1 Tax=Companilactobacillus ginsenosidimutans TaxID=1007676 RepID=A0A0H4QGY7_9LACO|nr:type II toxin-antitoxin system PemK/MazF family toxin [Companilactobacillus ginsenosidimutans]AKP67202.1 hypothetical protein ABM34_06405 [Companilactobacillus ginsenosidimutans]
MEKKFHGEKSYIPHQKDVIYINLNPLTKKEKWHRSPAVVISNRGYNSISGLVIIALIHYSNDSDVNPVQLSVPLKTRTLTGNVNTFNFYTVDYENRNIEFIDVLDNSTFRKIKDTLNWIIQ